jgi:hypothetical protein
LQNYDGIEIPLLEKNLKQSNELLSQKLSTGLIHWQCKKQEELLLISIPRADNLQNNCLAGHFGEEGIKQ